VLGSAIIDASGYTDQSGHSVGVKVVSGDVTLIGLHITGGNCLSGCGISMGGGDALTGSASGTVAVISCTITGNTGSFGAGIYVGGAASTASFRAFLINSTITQNVGVSDGEGAGLMIEERPSIMMMVTIEGCNISANRGRKGSGVCISGRSSRRPTSGCPSWQSVSTQLVCSGNGGLTGPLGTSTPGGTLSASACLAFCNTQGAGCCESRAFGSSTGACYWKSDPVRLSSGGHFDTKAVICPELLRSPVTIVDIRDSSVSLNSASDEGAGVFMDGGSMLTVSGSRICNNTSGGGAGGVRAKGASSSLTILRSEVSWNVAASGGAMYIDNGATMTLVDVHARGNQATTFGGGLAIMGGTVNMTSCHIYENDAGAESNANTNLGGGIYIEDDSQLIMDLCEIHTNRAGYSGGGIQFQGGISQSTRSAIYENTAILGGGALLRVRNFLFRPVVRFVETDIYGNRCDFGTTAAGGGLGILGGTCTLEACRIYSNEAYKGSGVYVHGGGSTSSTPEEQRTRVTIFESEIFMNRGSRGAGLYPYGGSIIMLVRSDVHDNVAAVEAGGLMIDSLDPSVLTTVTLNDTRVRRNSAHETGGGVLVQTGTLLMFGDSRIDDNDVATPVASDDDNVTAAAATGDGRRVRRQLSTTTGLGRNIVTQGGAAYFGLPGPPGRWLPSAECRIYRRPCPASFGSPDPSCLGTIDLCAVTPDSNGIATVTYQGAPVTCQPVSLIQPCDWQASPELLGKPVYTLPLGIPVEANFPYLCAPGILGSTETRFQGSAACAGPCPAGKRCPDEATIEPLDCEPGAFCPSQSASSLPCPPGTFSNRTDNQQVSDCVACSAGMLCPVGSTEPRPCDPGTYNPSPLQSECSTCPGGQYQSSPGETACSVCGAGNYSANILSCELCQVGEYCPAGAVVGTRCPTGFTTASRGATSLAGCGCFAGLYEKLAEDGNRSCVTCPDGTECNDVDVKLETLPVAAGHWRQHRDSIEVRPCFTADACLGGGNVSTQCEAGQTGPYCAVCADGYYGGGNGMLCQPCEGSSVLTFLPAIIIGVVLVLCLVYVLVRWVCCTGRDDLVEKSREGAYAGAAAGGGAFIVGGDVGDAAIAAAQVGIWGQAEEDGNQVTSEATRRRRKPRSEKTTRRRSILNGLAIKAKIIVALFQMLAGVGITYAIQYPPVYLDALNWISSILQFDLPQAMPLGCVLDVSYYSSLIVRTALPLLVIALLLACSKLFNTFKRADLAAGCSAGWFFVLFLVYPGCSAAVFSAFVCDDLEDGTPMLRVDYSITCWEGEHVRIVVYAFVMILVYPVGTPLLYSSLLYANADALERIRRAEAVANAEHTKMTQRLHSVTTHDDFFEASSSRLVSNEKERARREWSALPASVRKLTAGYTMQCYWFEIFECLRKICLVGLPVFLPSGSAAQLICGLLVCFISAMMYAAFNPYVDHGDDKLSKACQVALFFSLVSSIALTMERDSSEDAVGTLLLFTLIVPPVLGFFYEAELEFDEACGSGESLTQGCLACFRSTLGRCIILYCKSDTPRLDDTSPTTNHSVQATTRGRFDSMKQVSVTSECNDLPAPSGRSESGCSITPSAAAGSSTATAERELPPVVVRKSLSTKWSLTRPVSITAKAVAGGDM